MDPEILKQRNASPPATSATPTTDPRHQQASSQSPPQIPHYLKTEPDMDFSVATERTTQTPNLVTNTSFYCQGGPQFNVAAESQAGFEHYALHSSPTAAVFPSQVCSNQSSPRSSWGSPDQFRSLSWEPANNNGLASHLSRQSQQSGGFPLRDSDMIYLPSATSYPTTGMYASNQSFDSSESSFHVQDGRFGIYQTASYPMAVPDGLPVSDLARPLSACSSSLGGLKADTDLPSPAPASEPGDDLTGAIHYPKDITSRQHCHSPQSSTVNSPTSGGGTPGNVSNSKQEEPYAQLIYRAFMSTPRRAMTLQDLYQWFRENTDKGKSDTKGWQNSIRHNLSMNMAFTKRERRHSGAYNTDDLDGSGRICLSSDAVISDNKNAKSTEWYLEPQFAESGVMSTTRYRSKGTARHQHRHGSAYSRSRDAHPKVGGPSAASGHSTSGIHGGSGKKGSQGHGQIGSSNGSRLRGSRHHSHPNNTTSSPMQGLQQQHYNATVSTAHHQLHARHQPMPSMIGDAAAYGAAAAATAYLDYPTHPPLYAADYAHPHAHTHSPESGVDEPMTPEPTYSSDLLIPDLHRVGAPSSSSSRPYEVDAAYPYPHPAAPTGGMGVGVYDEMVDRYSGWAEEPAAAAYHQQY